MPSRGQLARVEAGVLSSHDTQSSLALDIRLCGNHVNTDYQLGQTTSHGVMEPPQKRQRVTYGDSDRPVHQDPEIDRTTAASHQTSATMAMQGINDSCQLLSAAPILSSEATAEHVGLLQFSHSNLGATLPSLGEPGDMLLMDNWLEDDLAGMGFADSISHY